jgi:hypothetical protein
MSSAFQYLDSNGHPIEPSKPVLSKESKVEYLKKCIELMGRYQDQINALRKERLNLMRESWDKGFGNYCFDDTPGADDYAEFVRALKMELADAVLAQASDSRLER